MGYNATVIFNLDQLMGIEKDQNFGRELVNDILSCNSLSRPIHGNHGVVVAEVHHSGYLVPVIVGRNTGRAMRSYLDIKPGELDNEQDIRVLKDIARRMGYRVSKITNKD